MKPATNVKNIKNIKILTETESAAVVAGLRTVWAI